MLKFHQNKYNSKNQTLHFYFKIFSLNFFLIFRFLTIFQFSPNLAIFGVLFAAFLGALIKLAGQFSLPNRPEERTNPRENSKIGEGRQRREKQIREREKQIQTLHIHYICAKKRHFPFFDSKIGF